MEDLEPDDYKSNPLLNPHKYISKVRAGLNYVKNVVEGRADNRPGEGVKDLEETYDGLLDDAAKMKKLIDDERTLAGSDRVKMKNIRNVFKSLIGDINAQSHNVDLKTKDLEWQASHS